MVGWVSELETEAIKLLRNQYIKSDEPAYWDKISDKWDMLFPELDIHLDVDVSIELAGTTK